MPRGSGLSKLRIRCDDNLKAITHKDEIVATELAKLTWAYIREHNLVIKEDKKGE